MWIMVYLFQETLKKIFNQLPLPLAFLATGTIFGLLTEFFAVLNNLKLPPDKRILLHPNPAIDLLMGLFYYFLFIVTWYLLLRKIKFSKTAVFIFSGLFGIIVEQNGAILFGIFSNPLLGSLMAILVACVYGIFPLLAYTLTEERFIERRKVEPQHYLLAAFAFFLFWAIYGNIFYKGFIVLFPK